MNNNKFRIKPSINHNGEHIFIVQEKHFFLFWRNLDWFFSIERATEFILLWIEKEKEMKEHLESGIIYHDN